MSLANEPVAPLRDVYEEKEHLGWTKLQIGAFMILQGLVSDPANIAEEDDDLADIAIARASALLAKLEAL